jgi:predicted nucleic acid-binding protein
LGQWQLLRQLYGEIIIPPAVRSEVEAGGMSGHGAFELENSPWIRVVYLTDPREADLIPDVDRGEAEVIALAVELKADVVIIDERLGRRHALRLGLPLTGTLGILLKAKQRGLVTSICPLIKRLRDGGIWLADKIVAETLRQAGEGN